MTSRYKRKEHTYPCVGGPFDGQKLTLYNWVKETSYIIIAGFGIGRYVVRHRYPVPVLVWEPKNDKN